MAFVLGATALGTSALTTTVVRNPPTVAVVAPGGVVSTQTTAADWTYTSPISRPQIGYRIVLEAGGESLFDSGLIVSAAGDAPLAYVLSPFTGYRLWVGVWDGLDGAGDPYGDGDGWGFIEFSTDDLIVVFPPNPQVGGLYEIAINGVGYMLADDPELFITRKTVHLEPERFATGDTPFSEAIDRYTNIGHSDWTGGEGQLYLRRPRSDPSRYWYSEWVNPFEPGELSLTKTPERGITSTYTSGTNTRLVVASTAAILLTGNAELTRLDVPGGTPSAFNPGLAGTIVDLASDDEFWYATDGTTIRRGTGTSGSAWSSVAVTEIAWIGDRIVGLDTAATPDNITTLDAAGAEEVASGRFAARGGGSLRGICGGDGYMWYGENHVNGGVVRGWQVDSDDGAFIALQLPHGESVDNLFFYLGNVFISSQGTTRKIYRCVPADGRLVPELVHKLEGVVNPYRTWFSGLDRFVAFSWFDMSRDDESGIGVLDLETGGIARWQSAGTAAREVGGVATWAGEFAFNLIHNGDGGLWGLAEEPVLHAGFLETSVDDLSSNLTKALVELTITTKPLNGTVSLSISNNSNDTFSAVGIMAGDGATSRVIQLEHQLKSLGLRLDLTPVTDLGPVVQNLIARVHPLGITDQLIGFPVRCADRLKGLNQAELPESRPGLAMAQIRTLESLVGEMVSFQDIDWRRTQTEHRGSVISAETVRLDGVVDQNTGWRENSGVLVVTIRRAVA